jgi:hypothetical protein
MIEEGLSWFKFRGLIAFGLLFAGLVVYSMFDIAFLALGRQCLATVTDSQVHSGRRGRSNMVTIYWKFQEPDGYERTGHANIGEGNEKVPEGTELVIQYLPRWLLEAPDASRPARPFNGPILGLTLFSCLGCSFFAVLAIRAGSPPKKKLPSQRR